MLNNWAFDLTDSQRKPQSSKRKQGLPTKRWVKGYENSMRAQPRSRSRAVESGDNPADHDDD